MTVESKKLVLKNLFCDLQESYGNILSRSRNITFYPTEWGHSGKNQYLGMGEKLTLVAPEAAN
jgi:hypothetical protein